MRVPELKAEIAPVPSIPSIHVAPGSANVAPESTSTVDKPTRVTTGAVVSMINDEKVSILLSPSPSSTVREHVVCVPSANELSVIVLSPDTARVVAEEHGPEYAIVPPVLVLNV